MENCLEEVERVWLKNGEKDFIGGGKISVADILAACEMEQPGINPFFIPTSLPLLCSISTYLFDYLKKKYLVFNLIIVYNLIKIIYANCSGLNKNNIFSSNKIIHTYANPN